MGRLAEIVGDDPKMRERVRKAGQAAGLNGRANGRAARDAGAAGQASSLQGEAREDARHEREEREWPDPDLSILEERREPAPALPMELFGPSWSRWIGDAAAGKGCAPDFVALPLLSAASGLLANVRRGSPWSGWCEPPVINTASVGKPSSGKSPGLDAMRELAAALEAEWNQDLGERERRYRTDREEAEMVREGWRKDVKAAVTSQKAAPLEPEKATEPDLPEPRRLVIGDTTAEKAARLAAVNPRGLVLVRDELAGWIGSMDRYGGGKGGDRAFWLETYGGRPYTVDRVKDARPVRVPHLSIAITGGIQPDKLARMLCEGADDGQAARFLYAWPERVPPTRPTALADDEAALARLRRLRDLPPPAGAAQGEPAQDGQTGPAVLPFDEDAVTAIQAWRVRVFEMEGEVEGLYCSWLGKLPGMAVRLAVVLEHLWWCSDDQGSEPPARVSAKAVEAAIAFLGGYAAPMARRVFGDAARSHRERDAAALGRWLVDQAEMPATVNAREVRRSGILPDKEVGTCAQALAGLRDAGWLRPTPARAGDTKGRRRDDWTVNPKLRERDEGS